jgi:surfeit locus 1 family protein
VIAIRARGGWRRLLAPMIVTATALAMLIALGIWQLERKAWKESLIATLQQRTSAAPAALPRPETWANLTPEDSEFRRVKLQLEFLDRLHAWLYTSGSALREDVKSPGYFVFVPARLPNGQIVVVNTGYAPERQYPWKAGQAEIVGYLRWPDAPTWFVSEHDTSGGTWFVRDQRAMAQVRGWGEVAPFYIDQEGPVPPGGLPRPGAVKVNLRNDHLGYALTWFGLAAALGAIFALWAWKELRRGGVSSPETASL